MNTLSDPEKGFLPKVVGQLKKKKILRKEAKWRNGRWLLIGTTEPATNSNLSSKNTVCAKLLWLRGGGDWPAFTRPQKNAIAEKKPPKGVQKR